jgi:hypothetical protein
MKKFYVHLWLPHVIAVLIFLALSMAFFSPVIMEDKDLVQGDVTSVQGWGKDLKDYHKETGDYAFWSNTMFSGMPANYTYIPPTTNVFKHLSNIFRFGLPGLHVSILFIYMLGFYIFLLSIGCKPWLSIIGAIAYAFGSYNLIIIEAGHVNKGLAMATMAPIMGGIILCYRRKYLIGALVTLIFTGINIHYNHQQISYYILFMIVCLVVVYFIYAIREKKIKQFFIASAILAGVAILATFPAIGSLLPSMDYAKETMRGGAVLQTDPDGKKESSGLEVDYAFAWSYGKAETMTLLIPDFYGGVSKPFDKDSETYKQLMSNFRSGKISEQEINEYYRHTLQYWGDQPFTSGPVYAGAIVFFLFILGLFVVKGPEKWWLLAATILSILLSWGRNFAVFNEFLFYHLPLYNKFRTPSMALVIAGLTMATLAILALKEIIERRNDKDFKEKYFKPLYISGGITAGLCLFFALFAGSLLSFAAPGNANLPEWMSDSLRTDRLNLLAADAWRSLVFIILGFAAVWAFMKYKMKAAYLIAAVGVLILVDLWNVDRRYLNETHFVPKKKAKTILPTEADKIILQDVDPNFRVLNLASSTFNESQTSFFHKSIGGYSPAKLRRYQDMIDFHIGKEMNSIYSEIFATQGNLSYANPNRFPVLNMLNTKYVIVPVGNGNTIPIVNPHAFGNAWFVDSIRWVNSPDEEIQALFEINPRQTALIDIAWKDKLPNYNALEHVTDSEAYIVLSNYVNPGYLIYESSNSQPQLALFSEVFYKTWKAYINGEEVPLIRANYILRALPIPAGKHTIEFKNVDEVFNKAAKISLWSSIFVSLCMLALVALLILSHKRKNKKIVNIDKLK